MTPKINVLFSLESKTTLVSKILSSHTDQPPGWDHVADFVHFFFWKKKRIFDIFFSLRLIIPLLPTWSVLMEDLSNILDRIEKLTRLSALSVHEWRYREKGIRKKKTHDKERLSIVSSWDSWLDVWQFFNPILTSILKCPSVYILFL